MAEPRALGTPAAERERRVCERSFVGAVIDLGWRCWRVQLLDDLSRYTTESRLHAVFPEAFEALAHLVAQLSEPSP